MNPFLEGVIFGLTLAMLLGPALFALIQTSIHRGFSSGFFLAFGIFLSDILLVVLCFLGALQILNNDYNRLFFGIVSGLILIGYGVVTFIRKVEIANGSNQPVSKKPGFVTFIIKGFFLNGTNPFAWFFWMGLTVGVTSNFGDDQDASVLFFMGALVTVFATDLIKAFIARQLKAFLNEHTIKILNQVVGVILVLYGIILMARALIYHLQIVSPF